MSVFIPCLNVDSGNNLSGSGIQIVSPQSIAAGLVNLAGTAIPVTIGETVLYLNPITAIIAFAINWEFWANLFGLGETRIDREKQEIQVVLTAIFRFLNTAYDVPLRDGHALLFPSDGVQKQFDARPEIGALAPTLLQTSEVVTKNIFAHGVPTQGQKERTVNQYLANASINNWPVTVTQGIWDGLVAAADPTCAQDPVRWLKNPSIVRSAGLGAAILQYIPLNVLLDMAVGHHIGDPLLESLIMLWADNPQLVANITPITGLPWQSIYTEGRWALPPYGYAFGYVMPLLERDHIQPIIASITVPLPRYPNFTVIEQPLPPPVQPQGPLPAPQPPVEPPTQGPQPPPQPPNVVVVYPQGPPPPTQEQKDYACYISRLLYGNSQLTQSELAWYNNPNNIFILNDMIQVPECKQAIVRPVPQPETPHPPQWTSQELDIACYISRLLYGNSVLSKDEADWTHDPHNAAILTYQVNNPQCKTPLRREQPGGDPQPQAPNCPQPQPFPGPGQQPGPVWPIPPQQPPPGPQPQDDPCQPNCQHQIDVLRQRQQECCDELEQAILPRVIDLEHWVWDIERRVPGDPPPLPQPYPIPPSHNVPGTDIPFPPPDTPGGPGGPLPPIPPEVIECLRTYCEGDPLDPPAEERDVIGWALGILCRCGRTAKTTARKVVLDACQFGIHAWGFMAECWLNAYTPEQSLPLALPTKLQSLEEISKSFDDYLATGQSEVYESGVGYGTALIDYGLRLRADLPAWPLLPDDVDVDYIFVDRSTSPNIELPVTETTGP